jgi:parallel beta-helix repeat protein
MRLSGSSWRRFALLLLLLLPAQGAPTTIASPDGLAFTVDIKRPASADHDGTRNYRTLTALLAPDAYPKPGEHDAVLIAPGVYPGDLVIAIKGLILRAPAGPEKTVIGGQITLTAPDVTLDGLRIKAAGAEAALRLDHASGTRFEHGQLSEGRIAGLLARESDSFTVQASRITDNSGRGIWIADHSQGAKLDGLQVQGNGGVGIAIEQSNDAQITASTISLNGAAGIDLETAQGAEIQHNLIQGNAGPGIQLVTNGGSYIEDNEVVGNASFGILLRDSSDNSVIANFIHDNDRACVGSGGIGIEAGAPGARGNRLERNQIEAQAQPEAVGIALRGRVTGSEIRENQINQNYRGIALGALGGEGPQANRLIANQISASKAEGLLMEASGGANLIQGNEVAKNLQVGIRVNSGGRDQLQANVIRDNGAEGIWLRSSPDETLSGNRITHNGKAGLRLEGGSDGAWIENGWIAQNGGDGLALIGVRSARVQSNSFSANQGVGIRARNAQRLRAQGNEIESNRDVGIHLDSVTEIDMSGNRIHGNRQGGIAIAGASQKIDLSENSFVSNGPFGLKAESTVAELVAQRNWWGAAEGPSGVSPGGPATADKVEGVTLAAVFPWLPAPPDQVSMRSVRGLIVERVQGGEALDARDVAGAKVQLLSDVKGGPALLLLARPSQTAFQRIRSQPALALAYVQIAGASSGSAEIAFAYSASQLSPQTSSNRLQLFRLGSGGSWPALESHFDAQKQLVIARLSVSDLRNALITLAWTQAVAPESTQSPPISQPRPTPTPVMPQPPMPGPAPIAPRAGETLLLPAGEYTQDIQLDRAGATLGSRDPAHPAIIHGQITISAPNVTVQHLLIQPPNDFGLEVQAAGARILNNEIRGARIGIYLADGASDVEIRGNRIEENALGLSLEKVVGAQITFNRIATNSDGGLLVEASQVITVERNDFIENGSFSMKAVGTIDLTAQLNWWGDPRGSQSTTSGLPSEVIFPWLTMPFAQNQQLTTLRFTPHSAGERFTLFLNALLKLDLSRAWSALRAWTIGTETLNWQAAPSVRLSLEGLRTAGRAILAQTHDNESNQAIYDLVLVDLNPERATLMLRGGPSAVQILHFDDQAQRWLAVSTESWTFRPSGTKREEPNAWRWLVNP